MKYAIALTALLAASQVHAACVGSGSFQSCYDDQGNNYTVTRTGNITTVNGTNSQTGSNWNSTSNRVGNTTYQTGTSSSGGNWNQTIQNVGGTRIYSGQDSGGNSFYRSCNQYGCY